MALTYNIYTSNSLEGVYTKIKEGITTLNTTLEASNPDLGEIKYVRVSATNEYGEGFLSQAIKTIFIGKPIINFISSFKNGYILEYTKGNFATSKILNKSTDGTTWVDVKTDTAELTAIAVDNITTPIYFKSTSSVNEESIFASRDSDIKHLSYTPQNYVFICDFNKLYRYKSGVGWESFSISDYSAMCYIGNNTLIAQGMNNQTIYKSLDNGATWGTFSNMPSNSGSYNGLKSIKNVVLSFNAPMNGSSAISFDFGTTFKKLTVSIPSATFPFTIGGRFAYFDGKIIGGIATSSSNFMNTICISTDNGSTFEEISNLRNFSTENMELNIDYVGDNTLLAWADRFNHGIYYSTNGGITWNVSNVTSGFHSPRLGFLNNGVLMMGIYNYHQSITTLYRSSDRGKTWTISTISGYANSSSADVTPVYIGNNTVIIPNIKKISYDNGVTWGDDTTLPGSTRGIAF